MYENIKVLPPWVWGAKDLKKKRFKRNAGFSFKVRFFLTFLHGFLNSQNYELAPQCGEDTTNMTTFNSIQVLLSSQH